LRAFLIIISFLNTILYMLFWAYYDNILSLLGLISAPAVLQSLAKDLLLIIIGFCIGLIAIMLLNLKLRYSFFDFKNLALLGLVPFILLILSRDSINGYIVSRFFSENNDIKELFFYLFSRKVLFSIWFGFALGTSVRPNFSNKKLKRNVKYTFSEKEIIEPKQ